MGSINDSMSVVDSQLRVRGGILRLRIIDSSIIPFITDGFTFAPTVMIGERGAQFIKDHYNL